MESAKTIKSLYCNQSTMNELVFQHFKSWYPQNGQTCDGPLCGFQEAESIGADLPVINIGYMKGLANFVCNVPKEQVLVVYGPSGSGIKKGLEHMVQVWREQGRAVVRVDLSNFGGCNSTDELFGLIQKAILDGFKGRALTVTTIQALNELLKGDAKERENDDDFITLLKKLIMKLPLTPILRRTLSGFYDSKISSLDSFLGSFMTGDTAAVSQIDFHNFLRAMDIISLYQPDLAPIIIFQRFETLKGTILIDSIFELLKEHEQVGNSLPIVISTRNTQWFHEMNFLQLTDSFITFEVWELDKGTTKEILVETLKIWTEEDYDIIWEALGGHAGSIMEAYKYNRFFALKIDKALEKVHEFAYRTFTSSISQSRSDSSAQGADKSMSPVNVLSKLLAHDYNLVLETIEQVTDAMESLIEANLLYVDSGLGLRPVSRSIQVAIKKYLEALPEQKAQQTTEEKPQEATREEPQETTQEPVNEPQEGTREEPQETTREPAKEPQEGTREEPQETTREPAKEPQEGTREEPQETTQEPAKEPQEGTREEPQESTREPAKEPQEATREEPQESTREPAKEPQEATREEPQETTREPAKEPQEGTREEPQESTREPAKEPQEATREEPQESIQEPAKEPQAAPGELNPESDSTNEEQNPMKTQTRPQQSEESQTQMEQPKDTEQP